VPDQLDTRAETLFVAELADGVLKLREAR